jgi:Zn-dependent protease with chaperone function
VARGLPLMSATNARPSLARRALVAIAVLGSFYAVTATIALALLPLPVLAVMHMRTFNPFMILVAFACCWIPSYGLIMGLLGVRPPKFTPPGRELARSDAPALFAMIDDLAAQAGVAPPSAVYVSPLPSFFVCETGGGFFGSKSRRVLCIGAPFLATFSVGELRAVLAHELGHYLGGDTRLAGLLAYTEGAFSSVLDATERDALQDGAIHWMVDAGRGLSSAIGEGLVKLFAKVYLKLTRPMSRRQELAADVLSAELAGRETAIRALEQAHVIGPLYDAYLANELAPAIEAGAMPTDIASGFDRFTHNLRLHGKVDQLTRAVKEEKTDPFDTHPALADRVAALRVLPPGPEHLVNASARTLLDGDFALDAWIVDATFDHFSGKLPPSPVPRMTWRDFEVYILPTKLYERARETAAKLHPLFPHAQTLGAMLGAVVYAYETGRMAGVVATVTPDIRHVPPAHQQELGLAIAAGAVASLFEGALLERGATLGESLGERCNVFLLGAETVRPGVIAVDAMENDVARCELARWTSFLAGPPVPSAPPPATSVPVATA